MSNLLEAIDKTDWQTFRFDEIAHNISKRVEPGATDLTVYVGLEHLDSGSLHIKRTGSPADVDGTKLLVYAGDVIFGRRRAYQRKAAIATFDGICSAHALVLRANPEVIEPRLFPFFLHSDAFMHRAVDISVGGLSPTINWGNLRIEEFQFPPRDQQARLAELLWAADAVQSSIGDLKLELEKTRQAYILEAFTQKNGVEELSLKDVAKIKRGKFAHRPRNDARFFGGDIPFIQTGDVVKAVDGVILEHSQTLNEMGLGVSKIFRKGTIVMTITGANTGEVAELGIDAAFPDSMIGIQPVEEKVSKEYLHLLLRLSKRKLMQNATKNTQENLNVDIVNRLNVLIHGIEEQREILDYCAKIQVSLSEAEGSERKIVVLKNSIINKTFRS